jgi:hypothetical protein
MKKFFIYLLPFLTFESIAQSFIDASSWGTTGAEQIDKIIADKDGNTLAVGYFDANNNITIGQTILKGKGDRDGLIIKSDKTGKILWAKNIGGPNLDWIYNATTDANGNIYVCGKYGDFAEFDSKNPLSTRTTSGLDGFVAKYDKDGNFIWVKTINGTSQEIIYSVAIDENGNIYLAGYTGGTADMDPSTSIVNITSLKNADGFLIKLDANGKYIWHIQLGSNTASDEATNVIIDKAGNPIVLGYFSGTMDIDPTSGVTNLVAPTSNENAYLCKYTSDGKLNYGILIGSTASCNIRDAVIDVNDNISICGRFSGTCSFDGTKSLSSNGGVDGFVATFDAIGKPVKSFKIGGSNFDIITSIFVDNAGNYFITGNTQSQNVNFNLVGGNKILSTSAFSDIFFAKYDKNLQLLHSSIVGGSGYDGGTSLIVSQGRISVSATFENTVDFDPSTKNLNLTSKGGYDIAIISFSEFNVAINNIENNISLNLFPNPTEGFLFSDLDFRKSKRINIYNNTGQNIYKSENNESNGIDITIIPAGVYTILINWKDGKSSRSKIIKL